MLRLSVFVLFIVTSWQASALTFKSGEPLQSSSKITAAPSVDTSPYNPQYEKYKDVIATPLRDLKVYEEFTLVDDAEWNEFVNYHNKWLKGNWGRNRGQADFVINQEGVNPDNCVHDVKNFDWTSLKKEWKYNVTKSVGRCMDVLYSDFYNNPSEGIEVFADLLMYWEQNNIFAKQQKRRLPKGYSSSIAYAVYSLTGHMMAHYALYHRMYGFTQEQHEEIDTMFTNFVKTWDYYQFYRDSGSHFATVCDLTAPVGRVVSKGTNDHCGSQTLRIATGATLYGLEFGNQSVYDHGIMHLEIALATIDEIAGYGAHMNRGMYAIDYSIQFIAPIDQLHYAFDKAFGYNFLNMKNHNNRSPMDYYKTYMAFWKNPKLWINEYPVQDLRRLAEFEKIKTQVNKSKRASGNRLAGAAKKREIILHGPSLAKQAFPKLANYYFWQSPEKMRFAPCCDNHATEIHFPRMVGFNPYILRDATGRW